MLAPIKLDHALDLVPNDDFVREVLAHFRPSRQHHAISRLVGSRHISLPFLFCLCSLPRVRGSITCETQCYTSKEKLSNSGLRVDITGRLSIGNCDSPPEFIHLQRSR